MLIEKRNTKLIGKKAQFTLFTTNNCGLPTFKSLQHTFVGKDYNLSNASAGLIGGLMGKSSTCSIVSGGALGLALILDTKNPEWGADQEIRLHSTIKEYSQ